MARLRGTGLGSGMALGTAAIVRKQSGVPLMPEPPARLNDPAFRRGSEKPEVILVAEDYQTALNFAPALSWATVTGIAAEQEAGGPVSRLPAVVGAVGLMEAAADDVLILVDAALGVIFVDPDAMYLAQYTAEQTRFAPKHRIFLDELHQPAQTVDGRTITVIADAGPQNVESALNSGADAIYHELPLTFDADLLRNHLIRVAAAAAGKHLIVPYNEFLPLRPIVEAAVTVDLTLVVPAQAGIDMDASAVAALTAELAREQRECLETDTLCGLPRIGAELVLPDATLDTESDHDNIAPAIRALADQGATRFFYAGALQSARDFAALEALCAAAAASLVPVYYLGDAVPQSPTERDPAEPLDPHSQSDYNIRLLLGTGISGMTATNDTVETVKAAIRGSSDAESQAFLVDWLQRST